MKGRAKPGPRAVAAGLVAAAAGCAGALPLAGGPDAQALLAWLALLAPAAGCATAALGLRPWPYGLAVPGIWLLVLVAVDVGAEQPLPQPFWAALVVGGLFAAGAAPGLLLPDRPYAGAGALLLAAGLLAGLPGRGGLTDATWAERSPAVAAALFDASPVALALECAGVDWMRHPAAYRPAGTDWFSDVRRPWRGFLAGPVVLVVGCLLALAASVRARRRGPHGSDMQAVGGVD